MMAEAPGAEHHDTADNSAPPPLPGPIGLLPRCVIRPYHASDAPALALAANNPKIAIQLGDAFPSPYNLADAESWIRHAQSQSPTLNFAIIALYGGETGQGDPTDAGELKGQFAGGIGLHGLVGDKIEHRTQELGYWLTEEHWGKGLMTEAVVGFSRWAFENVPDLHRLEIRAHEGNEGSCRVAIKAGYQYEGLRREAGYKAAKGFFGIELFGLLRQECLV
jgi:[ribosomal protein S5]-alanine N-acetyltransferase